MIEEEYIRNRFDMINNNSYYGLMTAGEIERMALIERMIEESAKDLQNKVDKWILQKEERRMKATSVQNIKNVNDICFSIENYPVTEESKLIIVASTNDDIFAFEFEGPDLLQNCKKAGLFTGWEKEQKIRELKKENKKILDVNKELQEKIFRLEKQLNHEKAACNAYHNFFKKYAGKDTELELTYISGSRNNAEVETEYTIVDKEEYKKEEQERMELRKKFIAEVERCTKLRSELIDLEEKNKKLEELKTPTIENFTDEESNDNVNHPSHYTGRYECIDVMQDVFGEDATNDFCLCNAFKYIWRTRKKNGLEDVKKAVWYLSKYIEEAEKRCHSQKETDTE